MEHAQLRATWKNIVSKAVVGAFSLTMFSVGFAHTALAAQTSQIDEGVYQIISKSAHKSLDLHGMGTYAGTNAEIYDQSLGHNQLFRISKNGSHYTISHSITGMSLDVSGMSQKPGANVALWDANGQANQQWDFIATSDGAYNIKSVHSGNMLDVMYNSTSNGANVCVYSPTGNQNQEWELKKIDPVATSGVYTIESSANPKVVLDVPGNSTNSDVQLGLWSSNGQLNQRFTVLYDGQSGYYRVRVGNSLKNLSVSGDKLTQESQSDSMDQLWRIGKNEDGTYYLLNAATTTFMTIQGSATASSKLVVTSGQSGQTQSFNLSQSQAPTVTDGLYEIASSADPTKVLDVSGASKSRSASLIIWNEQNSYNQMWKITSTPDGAVTIQNVNSNLYLTDTNSQLTHEIGATNASKWQVVAGTSGTAFKNVATGRLIDIFAGLSAAGTKVTTYAENFGTNQSFVLTKTQLVKDGTYNIMSRSALVQTIDVPGGSKNSGTQVISYEQNGGTNQAWILKNTSDGYVYLTNKNSGLRLATQNGKTSAGTPVVQELANDSSDSQKWRLSVAPDGGLQIWSKQAEVAIGVEGSKASNTSAIKIYRIENDPTMTWNFTAFDGSVGSDVKNWWNDNAYINKMRSRAAALGSDTNYSIMVDTSSWRLTVFKRTGSSWSLVRSMPCVVGDRTIRGNRKVYIVARALWKVPNGIDVNDFYLGYVENWISQPEEIDPRDGSIADRWEPSHNAYDGGQGIHFGVIKRSRTGCVVINYYEESKWLYENIPVNTTVSIF